MRGVSIESVIKVKILLSISLVIAGAGVELMIERLSGTDISRPSGAGWSARAHAAGSC